MPYCLLEQNTVAGRKRCKQVSGRLNAKGLLHTQDLQVVENPHPDLHLGLHPKEDNAALFSPDSVVLY